MQKNGPTSHVLVAVLCVTLLSGVLVGCSDSGKNAAKVNGTPITTVALDAEVAKLKIQQPSIFKSGSGTSEGTIRSTLLDELVDQELLTEEAKKQNITVTDAVVAQNLASLKAGYSDDAQFEAALKSAGYTLDTIQAEVKWELMSNAILAKLVPVSSVTDKEALAYYNSNKTKFKVDAAKRSSHILFAAKDEATAKKVLEQLQEGANFAAMAKEYSTDTASAQNGGDLGWPTQSYATEFQNAVDKLGKGEMSGLVKSSFGWHIIKVTDTRKAGQESFKAAKETVVQTLLSSKRQSANSTLVKKLRSSAKIEILDPVAKKAKSAASTSGSASAATLSTK
ncbi:MAG: peptidylprolyl isomerase [Coriobacteriia bacterium]|nr:peptidylprolyl isomerase [Coriobacteriia bacterium]